MSGLWVGVGGFALAILSDFLSIGRFQALSRWGFWVSAGILTYALFEVTLFTGRLNLAAPLVLAGWIILPLSFILLIYSLFIELPFSSTYLGEGVQQALFTGGTYALTRHPGLLWFGLFLVALLFVSRSRDLLIAAPVWFFLDMLWVVIQDRFIFVKLFRQYNLYQKETPMLIPNYKSLKRCIATLGKESR